MMGIEPQTTVCQAHALPAAPSPQPGISLFQGLSEDLLLSWACSLLGERRETFSAFPRVGDSIPERCAGMAGHGGNSLVCSWRLFSGGLTEMDSWGAPSFDSSFPGKEAEGQASLGNSELKNKNVQLLN